MAGKQSRSALNAAAMMGTRKSVRLVLDVLLRVLPENRLGDRIWAFARFVTRHRRFPTRRNLWNDALYQVKTTNEILDPLRVFVSDKEFVKIYVKAIVGNQYNVPTIDVLRNAEAVDSYPFPTDCCIKPTHASGLVILREGSAPVDRNLVRSWFDLNYYRAGREANYKTLRPKVIVEPLVFQETNVVDYKFFCYRGNPRVVQVDLDRYLNHRRKLYDADWNDLEFSIGTARFKDPLERPRNFVEMLEVASKISSAFTLVRVDLYSDGDRILVGEISNCSQNAGGRFRPLDAEKVASELLFSL